jgi:hypothetical protein
VARAVHPKEHVDSSYGTRVMKLKLKMFHTVSFFVFVMSILGETLATASTDTGIQDKTIESKKNGNLLIRLTNETDKLINGENLICVLFQSTSSARALDIRDVTVDFGLRVGRIQEPPITASLTKNGTDRYCGYVDLEESHYQSASYYTTVRFVEESGRKKSAAFFLTVSQKETTR